MRELKNLLYEQVSRIGKALASPKRLELIELLCQSEKTVEMLSQQALGARQCLADPADLLIKEILQFAHII